MRLQDAVFVVTDTETTGTDATRNRVIEIAAVKMMGGKEIGRFQSLINPGRSVPRRITEITGLTSADLMGAPGPEVVFPRFLDFLGEGVLVAHNLSFDLRFINAELARLGLPPLGNAGLCTLRLARRLLRGLRSKSLGQIADFYGIALKNRHRALGDALITAEVLRRFLSHIGFDDGLETLEALLVFQHRAYARTARHVRRIRDEVLPTMPERPGVYFMKDKKGTLLYIGKAKRLRTRVKSYFYGTESHAHHIRQLVETVRTVAWEETGTELGALLLESRLIKTHKPRFNRASRRYRNRPFIRLDTTHAFPRVSWQWFLTDDGAEYFGPLGGRRQAARVVDLIERCFGLRPCDDDTFALGRRCLYAEMGRCDAPCVEADVAAHYAEEVRRVREFLMGRDRAILDDLDAEMRAASAALDFETAAARRDEVDTLRRLLDKQQGIAAPVLEHNAVLILPVAETETVELFFVRFGRLVETLTLPRRPAPDEAAHLAARLAVHFDPAQPRPERYLKRETDEVRLLAHWMYVHRAETHQVFWDAALPPSAFADAVLAAMTTATVLPEAAADDTAEEDDDAADEREAAEGDLRL